MAIKGLITEEQIDDLEAFLEDEKGYRILAPTSEYEVLRASFEGDTLVVYRKANGTISIADKDYEIIRAFIKHNRKKA